MTYIINRADWAEDPDRWLGRFQGAAYGAGVSVIFISLPDAGGGPKLHQHPYSETFIIRSGNGLFTVGDKTVRAQAGQILVVPPLTPHKFTNVGPGLLETIDIHASESFITEWLE